MSPSLATLVCAMGMVGLFYLDRNSSGRASPALWVPVAWIWIVGSRTVSVWLGLAPADTTDVQLDSPMDRLVFLVLLVIGVVILARRAGKTITMLEANWPILSYWAFCLLSVAWSDFPEVAFKRWVKACGDLVIILIIATDADVKLALKRVLSRVGFILFPTSVLLIKYFPQLGRGFSPWDGTPWNTGVTTNKNSLGVIVFVVTLGLLWNVLSLLRSKNQPNRNRHLLAQVIALSFGVWLLVLANSATSRACFALGAVMILATSMPVISRHPKAVHVLIFVMVLSVALTMLFGGGAGIAHAMGRKADLTGRTEIWDALVPMVPNAIYGAGFETFWLGPRLDQVRYIFLGNPLNEAHNGFLEVYLNLGLLGVFLIIWILISGYRRAAAAFRHDPAFGSLLLAYVAAGAVYNVTEAGFRLLCPNWIFLLFAVVAATGVASTSKDVALRSVDSGRTGAPPLRAIRLRSERKQFETI